MLNPLGNPYESIAYLEQTTAFTENGLPCQVFLSPQLRVSITGVIVW
jgi:hypothetical protein